MSLQTSYLPSEDIEKRKIEATSDTDIEAEIGKEHVHSMADDDKGAFASDIARYKHNLMEHYVGLGWRYGQKLNEKEMTHPMLRSRLNYLILLRKDNEFRKQLLNIRQRGTGIYKK